MVMTQEQADKLILEEFDEVPSLNTMEDIENIVQGTVKNRQGYTPLISGHGFSGNTARNIYYKEDKLYEQIEGEYVLEYEELTLEELKEQLEDIAFTFKRVYKGSNYDFLKYVSYMIGMGIPMAQ